MKVKILKHYTDKNTGEEMEVGKTHEYDDARAKELSFLGFVTPVKEKKEDVKKEKK